MVLVENTTSDFDYIKNYKPQEYKGSEEGIKDFKQIEAKYFVNGEAVDPTSDYFHRNDNNLLNRSFVAIDFDDIADYTKQTFINHILERLEGYKVILYETISSGVNGLRFRLIVLTNRPMNKAEYKATVKKIGEIVEIPIDPASVTFSQMMGLPVKTPFNDLQMIINDNPSAVGFEVVPAEEEPYYSKLPSRTLTKQTMEELEANKLVEDYVIADKENLQDEHNYVNCIYALVNSVRVKELTEDQAKKYVQIIAMGNQEWEENNLERLESELRKNTKPKSEWTFLSKAKSVVRKSKPLQERLNEKAEHKRQENLDQWISEGSKGRKPKKLSTLQIAGILKSEITFCTFDNTENAKLAMYCESGEQEGIYTRNENPIRRLIKQVEPNSTQNEANEVIYHLANTSPIKKRTNDKNLIPVKNGIYCKSDKQLYDFTPELVFTSKIATDYVFSAVKPHFEDFDIDEWIEIIADNDPEVITLLWQVISASLNGNYTYGKMIILTGSGSNGKGTYQDLIRNIVGADNVASLRINQFDDRFNLSVLEEKTVNIGDDIQANIYIDDSANLNSVITGDAVMIDRKYQSQYTAEFKMTHIFSTNGMPRIKNQTDGTYRRLRIVPFNKQFLGCNENKAIKEDYIKRKSLREYVLKRAIEMDFADFIEPEASKIALEEYKLDNDPIRTFVEEYFEMIEEITTDQNDIKSIPTGLIYEYYLAFCHKNNYQKVTHRNFTNKLKELIDPNKWEYKKARYDNTLIYTNDNIQPTRDDGFRGFAYFYHNKPYQSIVRFQAS